MGPEPPLKSVTASLDASPENKWGRKKKVRRKKRKWLKKPSSDIIQFELSRVSS
ncbi:hypothetical protein LCGC14_0497520 [marine sediment metagenome]|uniref:Uncharacterized protein n=1 Tax=marine sediment metagenome TaxID=412755 RepID=A0A0F9SA31_9ZZZZ